MNRKNIQRLLKFFILLIIGVIIFSSSDAKAATDQTKPKITLSTDTTDPTAGKVKTIITATDKSGIKLVKWVSGSKDTNYFKEAGKTLSLDSKNKASVSITKNGIYTFYAKDKAGNESIKKITITNIDTTEPTLTIKKSTSDFTNKNIKLTLTIEEVGLGVAKVKYLGGSKTEEDFKDAGKEVSFSETDAVEDKYNNNQYKYTGKLTVKSNNTYTLLVEDLAGNQVIKEVSVKNIDTSSPVLTAVPATTKPTNDSVTVNITVTDEVSGVKQVSFLTGTKEIEDFEVTESNQSPTLIKVNDEGKGKFKVKTNGNYSVLVTDNAGNNTLEIIKISNIDTNVPEIALDDYTVMNQKATITYHAKDDESGISSVKYLKGEVSDINNEKWDTTGKEVTDVKNFTVSAAGNYSVMVEDLAGNRAIAVQYVELELKAVWISYLEFLTHGKNGYTEKSFTALIDTMFDNVVDMNMNAVVVQVRPFGDAMYESSYFPWSRYISGTQGVDPGFDPMEYMVEAAHERGLEFHAWLNPYRVTTANTDYSKLSEDNPARVWHEDDDKTNDRNVLSFGGNLYYNPASKEVQTLITNGIKEIVTKYDVDGIHFDDYFYPVLGSKYASVFDSTEYKTYVADCKSDGKKSLGIADWRRNNVNTLVKNIYKSIKKIDSNVQFGISPGGFIDSLFTDAGYYIDIKTWLSSDGYIDYICPQIYWTFSNSLNPYDKILKKWLSYRTSSTVKMYIGIANYRAGSTLEADWKNDDDVLRNQIEYGRDTGLVDGFVFFRYDFFYNKVTKPGIDRLLEIL